jgi:hypothetical protein
MTRLETGLEKKSLRLYEIGSGAREDKGVEVRTN